MHGLRDMERHDVIREAKRMEQRIGRNVSEINTVFSEPFCTFLRPGSYGSPSRGSSVSRAS